MTMIGLTADEPAAPGMSAGYDQDRVDRMFLAIAAELIACEEWPDRSECRRRRNGPPVRRPCGADRARAGSRGAGRREPATGRHLPGGRGDREVLPRERSPPRTAGRVRFSV
jgi:hypothetical protein